MALGVFELLMLLFFFGGDIRSDAVFFVDADDYFQAHEMDTSIGKMVELAAADPKDSTTEVRQLLALRVLGESRQAITKAKARKKVIDLLKGIAAGKKAQDRLGFSKEYAQVALARLQGNKIPTTEIPKDSVRKEALSWFPKSATIAMAADLRGGSESDLSAKKIRDLLVRFLPPAKKEFFYRVLNAVGNVRLSRASFCFVDKPQGGSEVVFRLTGKVLPDRLIKLARTMKQKVQVTEANRAGGTKLTFVRAGAGSQSMVFVDDSDLLVAATMTPGPKRSKELLNEVLAIRAGESSSFLDGQFKSHLGRVPATASGVLVGSVPKKLRTELPIKLTKIFAITERTKDGIEVEGIATMGTKDAAEKVATQMSDGKMKVLMTLGMLMQKANDKFNRDLLQDAIKAVEGLKVKANDEKVTLAVQLPSNVGMLMLYFGTLRVGPGMVGVSCLESITKAAVSTKTCNDR